MTHLNLVCWSLWQPGMCLNTSFSCKEQEGLSQHIPC